MKRSRFRLQTVLNLREHAEKERQRALGVTIAKIVQQEERLGRIEQLRQQILDNQRQTAAIPMTPNRMLSYSRYLVRLKREELTAREMLRALKQEEQKRRAELLTATKEKKILEKLKEKKQIQEQKFRDQLEVKALDELGMSAFVRSL